MEKWAEKEFRIRYDEMDKMSPGFALIVARCEPFKEKGVCQSIRISLPEITDDSLPEIRMKLNKLSEELYRFYERKFKNKKKGGEKYEFKRTYKKM